MMETNALATLAIESNEGENLAKYHSYVQHQLSLGPSFKTCFMPKNSIEFNKLYDECMSGRFRMPGSLGLTLDDTLRGVWGEIINDAFSELAARCRDKNRVLLDKYIDYFSEFVVCVDHCKDKDFTFHLWSGTVIESLGDVISGCPIGLATSREAPQLETLYLAKRLDDIFSRSDTFRDIGLLDSYNCIVFGGLLDSPEYKAMYAEVEKMLTEGTTLVTE